MSRARNAEGEAISCATCPDGTACVLASGGIATMWEWLAQLNAPPGFAGYDDWRIPTIHELQAIVDFAVTAPPAIDPTFHAATCAASCTDLADPRCSCTASDLEYGSATTSGPAENLTAFAVEFSNGSAAVGHQTSFGFVPHVRAVRGGPATGLVR